MYSVPLKGGTFAAAASDHVQCPEHGGEGGITDVFDHGFEFLLLNEGTSFFLKKKSIVLPLPYWVLVRSDGIRFCYFDKIYRLPSYEFEGKTSCVRV